MAVEATYYYKTGVIGDGKSDATAYRPDVPNGFKSVEAVDIPKGATVCVIRVKCDSAFDTNYKKQPGVTVASADTKAS